MPGLRTGPADRRARARILAAACLFPACLVAAAPAADDAGPFALGVVEVVTSRLPASVADEGGKAAMITQEDMQRFNRDNVGDALNLLAGVAIATNSRNEKTLTVRGFDSRQVPLYIDGIPVYVPYDGYVDFDRFTTADLAGIQLSKGFSSVAYGPNALGGAINLVSRRPARAFEGDVTAGLGRAGEQQGAVNLGAKRGAWYAQAGASWIESDGFVLPAGSRPTATEDGGLRNNAYRKDSKLSFKVGFAPSADSEYAISYYRQDGEKGQPPSTDPAQARYWRWPYWDKESLYFLSDTALGARETLKLRLYLDRYDNEVDSYTDGSYTTLRTSGRGSVSTGRSIYADRTDGGSVALESVRFSHHSLRVVGHYKTDEHRERDANGVLATHYEDELLSIGAEDRLELGPRTILSLGAARHELRPRTVFNAGNPYSLPGSLAATDAQAGIFLAWSQAARVHLTIARKSRLPTLKDRYSARLGTFIENPALGREVAVNYELGLRATPRDGTEIGAAVFYSDITDKIQAVRNVQGNLSQMQNIGEVRAAGVELEWRARPASWLEFGGGYTYQDLDNRSDPLTRVTDVPAHKLTAHALLQPPIPVELLVFAERDSSRWASDVASLDGFTILNVKAVYRPARGASLELGVDNATDEAYALADGFPAAGRSWFATARFRF